MSTSSLSWSLVPPPQPEGCIDEALQLVLDAINLGDPFDQATIGSIARDGYELTRSSQVYAYLSGALKALRDVAPESEAAGELHALLRDVDTNGAVKIGGLGT